MKTPCVTALAFVFLLQMAAAKGRHCMFRLHAEANPRDTTVFATSVRAQFSGKDIAIEKVARISERDVVAFQPYPAGNGNYGALFQLDDHGRLSSSMGGRSPNSKSTSASRTEKSTSLRDLARPISN